MRPRGTGHIVNIASLAGKAGYPGRATYCATKHAVVGLSEAVRAELRGTGVEVSFVMPGFVNTELTAGMTEARGVKTLTPEDVADEIVARAQGPALRRLRAALDRPAAHARRRVLPRRAREALARAMKADQRRRRRRPSKRAAYEARAAASAPAAERGAPSEAASRAPRPSPASRRSARRSARPGPPAGSGRRPAITRGAGCPSALAKRLARAHGQHRVLLAPQDQRRPRVLAQRGEHAPARLGARGVRARRQDQPGRRARPPCDASLGNGAS